MLKRANLFLLLATLLFTSVGQTIELIDESTGRPISDVFIYHENKTNIGYSGSDGVVNISEFPKGLIFVQHPSYYNHSVAYLGSDISITLKEKIISFNEVVISANKWEQEEDQISQQILSVNRKTIAFENPQTSADLLSNTGQVFVQKSQFGGGSPKLRGFSANSVLLVVDGIRMNNAIFRSGNLQNIINIDANALESSEVIFGPGSVIYGSDALGGVMDFHTITPNWSSDEQGHITGNLLTRYSSAANERTGHADLTVSRKNFAFFHSTTFSALSDLRSGKNRSSGYEGFFERNFYVERINGEDQLITNPDPEIQKFSGYNLFNTVSKARFKLSNEAVLSYGFYYSTTSDIPRYDRLTIPLTDNSDSLASAEWYYGPQEWQMHSLQLNSYHSNKFFDQARATLSYQFFKESRNDRSFGDDLLRTRTEQVDMYALSLDFDKELSRSNLYYGIDFFRNNIASDGFRTSIVDGSVSTASARYPDGGSNYNSFAVYGNLVNHLNEKLVLNTGLRFNHVGLSGATNDENARLFGASNFDLNNQAINGSIGLAYNSSETSKWSYHISSGFRSPNIDDVGKLFELDDNVVIVPNSNLKPEHSLSNELSYQLKTEKVLIKVTGFYSQLFDAIVRGEFEIPGSTASDTLEIRAQVNANTAEIHGASLMVKAELSPQFALSHSISYTDGKDITNDEPLRHTTPIFGKTELSHKEGRLRSAFYMEYNSNYTRKDIPVSEIDDKPHLYTSTGTPGWITFNLKSSYQISESIKVNGGIENILDQHYRPTSSGISAPGRNFILALRANF